MMAMVVRITIQISRTLLDELKTRASRDGRTLSEVVEEAIRSGLNRPGHPRVPIRLPVFEEGTGPQPGVDLTDTSRLLELTEGQ